MSKNIYIINSGEEDIYPLFSFFEELKIRGFNLFFFLNESELFKIKNEKKLKIKKTSWLLKDGERYKNISLKFLAPFLSPLLILFYFQKRKKINAVLLFGSSAKIIFRIPFYILKIKIILVENNHNEKKLKLFLKSANRICFSEKAKKLLIEQNIKEEKIKIILPALRIKDIKRQDNIFNKLAQNKNTFLKKERFFTIGTFADFNLETNLENIFLAIKKSLDIIPNIQLIIIGDGKNRKELNWLSQKMKIDNLIWFVGKQKQLGKWLDAFDIFINSSLNPSFYDFEIILRSLYAKVPIIASSDSGLNDLIKNEENGIITDEENSEEILKAILKLKKNPHLRKKLGENGFLDIQNKFNIKRMVDDFLNIL